jgi:hypothetical protein
MAGERHGNGMLCVNPPLNAKLILICHLLALLGARPLLYVSRIRVKNRASYIQDRRTATLQTLHFIYFFSTNISTEYFKHAAHSPFFSSKCRSFHNATFFWFLYYSHFTYRVCWNLIVKLRCQKVKFHDSGLTSWKHSNG